MTIYGHCDVKLVTWSKCSILIGRENFCCALIGQYLKGPPSLLTSKVSLLSLEDNKKIKKCGECVGPHAHNLVVSKSAKQGLVHHQETFEYVQRRFKETDLVVCFLNNTEMKLFVGITEADLKNNGYCCTFREEKIRCKNFKVHYGIGKEECRFNVTEHIVEFEW